MLLYGQEVALDARVAQRSRPSGASWDQEMWACGAYAGLGVVWVIVNAGYRLLFWFNTLLALSPHWQRGREHVEDVFFHLRWQHVPVDVHCDADSSVAQGFQVLPVN